MNLVFVNGFSGHRVHRMYSEIGQERGSISEGFVPKDIFGGFPALHRLVVNRSAMYFTTAGVADYQDLSSMKRGWSRLSFFALRAAS